MANQRISCVHNNLSRTIITLQLEQLSRFIPLLEGQDIFNIRPSKRIDGLCIIAHYAYMILWLSQSLHNQILRIVGILILIHQQIMKILLILAQHLHIVLEEHIGHIQQIVKIHRITCFQSTIIFGINTSHLWYTSKAILHDILPICTIRCRRKQLVFGHRYSP